MKCRHVQEMLVSYLDGTLSPQKGEDLRRHLSMCVECSTALSAMKRTRNILESLDRVEPPPWLAEKIMTRIDEESAHKGGLLEWLFYPLRVKIPIQAFAAILLVGLTILFYRANQPIYDSAGSLSREEKGVVKVETPPERRGEADSKAATAQSQPEPARDGRAEEERAGTDPTGPQETSTSDEPKKKSVGSTAPEVAATPSPTTLTPSLKEQEQAPAAERPRERAAKTEALRAALPAAAKAAKPGATIEIAVASRDMDASIGEVEKALEAVGARNIIRALHQESRNITADIKGDEAPALIEKLKAMGASVRSIPDPVPETVTVRIEIGAQ